MHGSSYHSALPSIIRFGGVVKEIRRRSKSMGIVAYRATDAEVSAQERPAVPENDRLQV